MHNSAATGLSEARNTPRYWLHRVATAAVVIALVIVASSAYLRQASLRFSCPDWPACTQRIAGQDPAREQSTAESGARIVHRLSASIAGAAVLLIVFLSSVQQPRVRPDVALSAVIVALTLFLAVLGRWSRTSQGPFVTLGNLLGGMTLLALLQWMRLRTSPAHAAADEAGRLAPVAGTALAVAFVVVSLGALISFNQSISAARAASDGVLASAHLLSGMLMLLLTGTLALHPGAGKSGRRVGAAAFALALALAMTGWISTRFDYPLAAALAHNLLAALLLMMLETAAYRSQG